ncbi:hypothetical protein AVEN_58936-1 [Araneus ventricosus]|uniref:Saposin B-type domain-containing protein n=1 Tax=Araneus ventricosus TaxID=182803 RepID=A0A4Y2ET95_ARAVE|nr:hypothetical protein AVEN_58936-1 [Araneus ventricosus]
MLVQKIYLYQLGLVLLALTTNSIELSDKIHGKVCDKIDDGKFRGELIKCMKIMPLEVQIVWRSCGAKYFNGTKPTCDYCEIITEMCGNPTYAQNVTNCVEKFKDEHRHHDLSLDLDIEGHEHSDSHDYSDSVGDDEDESEEEMHVVHDLSILISKECLKSLFSSYNITIKEGGKDKE